MLAGHLPELIILLVVLVVIIGGIAAAIWFFGLAVGRGIARGQRDK